MRRMTIALGLAAALLCTAAIAWAQEGSAIFLPAVLAVGDQAPAVQENAGRSPEERAIALVAAVPEMAQHLAAYPDWEGNAWPESDVGGLYGVDFYSRAAEEWLGSGRVDLAAGAVLEFYAPRALTPEEFQVGLAQVKAFLDDDPEVQARLGANPAFWYEGIDYNRWESVWEAYYERGLDAFVVAVYLDDGEPWVDGIYDPNAFDQAEAREERRNRAISLAWEAPGIDDALAGVDNWTTYAAEQDAALWTVEFVTENRLLLAVLVNIETWEILETQ